MTIDISNIYEGAISGENQVAIDISHEEAKELRKALEIVQKYEKMALNAF